MFSIDGLVTGLDTTKIINDLLGARQAQLDRLQQRKNQILVRQSAFKGIEAKLLSLKSAVGQIAGPTSDAFNVRTITSSNEAIVTAAATKNAAVGTHQFRVKQLARAEQVASAGFESTETIIKTGTLSIRVGSRSTTTITIDSQNNTVQGLVDAINQAGADATAAVVNDGATQRIVLTSKFSGLANDIVLDNQLNTGSGVAPDFSGPLLQDGADAQIILGQGAGAITVNHATNLVDDLFAGVTLNLLSADENKDIQLVIERDIEPAVTGVQDLVAAYNDVMEYIDQQTKFEQETGKAGVLLGLSAASDVQRQLRSELSRALPNITGDVNRLSAVGIRFDEKGRLQLDSARLSSVLRGEVAGATAADVRKLFDLSGQSTDTNVRFILGSSKTKESTNPYDVVITQAAAQAAVLSSGSLPATTNLASKAAFVIKIDGVESETLELQAGSYSQTALATELQTVINNSNQLRGRKVTVTVASNQLTIRSESFGKSSTVELVSGDYSQFDFTTGQTAAGRDVAGYFLVDGKTETATGRGRILIGDTTNENTSGLQLQVTLTAAQVVGEHHSDLTVTRGFGSRLNQLVDQMLDGSHGTFTITDESFQKQIESVEKSVERMDKIFEAERERMVREFAALETTVNSLRSTSNFLASQLTALSAFGAQS